MSGYRHPDIIIMQSYLVLVCVRSSVHGQPRVFNFSEVFMSVVATNTEIKVTGRAAKVFTLHGVWVGEAEH